MLKRILAFVAVGLVVVSSTYAQVYHFPDYVTAKSDTISKIGNGSQITELTGYIDRGDRRFTYEGQNLIKITERDYDGDYKMIPEGDAALINYEYFDNGLLKRIELWDDETDHLRTDNTFDPVNAVEYTYDSLGRVKTMKGWHSIEDSIDYALIGIIEYSYEGATGIIKSAAFSPGMETPQFQPRTVHFAYDDRGRIETLTFDHFEEDRFLSHIKTVKYKYKKRRPIMLYQKAISYEVHKYYDEHGKKAKENLHSMNFAPHKPENFSHFKYFLVGREWRSLSNGEHWANTILLH